ncbi:MAG: hypothetical protein GY853_09750 [PVC group bacterium]|nr:hypothetical protein [PVC group bacterium]
MRLFYCSRVHLLYMNKYKLAKTNLNKIRKNINSKDTQEFFKAIRPNRQSLESDNFFLSWEVQPELDFNEFIDGDFLGSIDKIKVKIAYNIYDSSEIKLEIKGKPFMLEEGEIKLVSTTYF